MKIYLDKDLVKDLDTDALLVYVALRSIYHKGEEELYVSINMLCYRLYGNVTYTRTVKDSIINGFNKLDARGIIRIKEQINKAEFIIDASGLYFEDKFFVGIDLEYIRRTCNCSSRVDRGSLVKYLLIMIGTLCNDPYKFQDVQVRHMKGLVGFMPISYIAQESGISETTALSYNIILEDAKIIYIYRHGHSYQDIDGNINSINNNYGLYENKKEVLGYATGFARMQGYTVQDGDANKRRSLAAKYNALCNGVQYTQEEVQEIYEYIHNKNQNLAYGEVARDESVFEGVI